MTGDFAGLGLFLNLRVKKTNTIALNVNLPKTCFLGLQRCSFMILRTRLVSAFGLALVGCQAFGVTYFQDDFESQDFSKWPVDVNPGFGISSTQVHSGSFSASTIDATAKRRAASIGPISVEDTLTFSFWMYDTVGVGGGGRQYSEIRSYAGEAYGTGGLEQLYAVGLNNGVTLAGETHSSSKYQGRVAFGPGTGWFNLTDAPNRSVGWHEFKIVLEGTTASFFVDGVLGRTITRGTVATIDSVVLGSGLSSANQPAFYDDFLVSASAPVPEPATLAALGLGAVALVRRRRSAK